MLNNSLQRLVLGSLLVLITACSSEPNETPSPGTSTPQATETASNSTQTQADNTGTNSDFTPTVSPSQPVHTLEPDHTPTPGQASDPPATWTPTSFNPTYSVGETTPTVVGPTNSVDETTPTVVGPTNSVGETTPTVVGPTNSVGESTPTPASTPTEINDTPTQPAGTPTNPPEINFSAALDLNEQKVSPYGGSYEVPTITVQNGLIAITGTINRHADVWQENDVIGSVPDEYCPAKTLIFDTNQFSTTAQVRLTSDCELVWISGDPELSWLSLAGIVYGLKNGDGSPKTPLSLANGLVDYGDDYDTASFSIHGDTIVLSGAIKSTGGYIPLQSALATLPTAYCPEFHRTFNTSSNDAAARIDVRSECSVLYMSATAIGDWVSLNGISFRLNNDEGIELELDGNNSPHSHGWGDVTAYHIDGELIHLTGLVINANLNDNTLLATLPEGLSPARHQIFNSTAQDFTSRVDITENGDIIYVTGNSNATYVSLDGIVFAPSDGIISGDEAVPALDYTASLVLNDALTKIYGGAYQAPTLFMQDNIVSLSGLVRLKTGIWQEGDVIGTVPERYCPDNNLLFATNQQYGSARVDLTTDCELIWVNGHTEVDWISLEGIVYSVLNGDGGSLSALRLSTGVDNYGGAYQGASYTTHGNRVILSGLIRNQANSWEEGQILTTLPDAICPAKQRVFNTQISNAEGRVDILADCTLRYQGGGGSGAWLSLSGISYVLDELGGHIPLTLANGLETYSATHAEPAFFVQESQIHLTGMVRMKAPSDELLIATLPAGARPEATHIFNVNQHDFSARLDIKNDGSMTLRVAHSTHDWLSLDGLVFTRVNQDR